MSDTPILPGSMVIRGTAQIAVKTLGIGKLPNGIIELAFVPEDEPAKAIVLHLSPKQAAFLEFRLLVEREEAGEPQYTPHLPD